MKRLLFSEKSYPSESREPAFLSEVITSSGSHETSESLTITLILVDLEKYLEHQDQQKTNRTLLVQKLASSTSIKKVDCCHFKSQNTSCFKLTVSFQ